ncbi:hypothetical protein C1H46_035111 [Malus baccata]|uniref:Uncharacterized protein n=1 Tax=Malus baccata TaxID=106549 RepID=A0A540KYP2_MALBA|nr:hypothetical protein C1H46_035111 [Malus baccata]
MVQRMLKVPAPAPNRKDVVVFINSLNDDRRTVGKARRVKRMHMPGTQVLASIWTDLGIGPKPKPRVSTCISNKQVDESSDDEEEEEADEEVEGEADDEEAKGEVGKANEEEQGDEEEEDDDDENGDEGEKDEDEGDGDEEEEEGNDFGHFEEEE